jgi:dipeptidase E
MRKTGVDKVLIQAIQDGKFYIGVSAGSIIVGPDIEISGWGQDADTNDIHLEDLSGFKSVPYYIFPHYSDRINQEITAFQKDRGIEKVVGLTDAQALFVTDEEAILIGENAGLSGDDADIQDRTI